MEPGTVLYYGAQGEKGIFFGGDLELKAPFDPKKLSLSFSDVNGWFIGQGVTYDGEDIDNYDYDTTGKWGEDRFIVVGGEAFTPVPEPDLEEGLEELIREFDEISLTDWFPADINPVRLGTYECVLNGAAWPFALEQTFKTEWNGTDWLQDGKPTSIKKWRGLNFDPASADQF
jgi:hypothetical protein